MGSKFSNLQSALNQTREPPQAPAPALAVVASAAEAVTAEGGVSPTSAARQANRHGKVNVSAWLDPSFKSSLRMVQARQDRNLQALLEEALNDLFAKYDVPQVR